MLLVLIGISLLFAYKMGKSDGKSEFISEDLQGIMQMSHCREKWPPQGF